MRKKKPQRQQTSGGVAATRRVIEGTTEKEISERDRGALWRERERERELNYANWRLEETREG